MSAEGSSSIYDSAVKPIVYSYWFLGMGVDRQLDLSDTANFFMQLYTILFIFLCWSTMYTGMSTLTVSSRAYDSPTYTMYNVLNYTNTCVAMMSPVLVWFQRKELRNCFRKTAISSDTFQTIIGAQNGHRKRYVGQILRIIAIFLVTFFITFLDMRWIILLKLSLFDHFAVQFTLHYPVVVTLMMGLNFCSSVRFVLEQFQELNTALLRLAGNNPGKKTFETSRKVIKVTTRRPVGDTKTESSMSDNQLLLREIRKAHLELCKLSRKINHAFGVQNLVSMSVSFVVVTGLLYVTYGTSVPQELTEKGLKEVVPSVLWAILYASEIWMVNHWCWRVSSETSRTGEIIYEFLESRVDKEFEKEVQAFAVQMLQNPVRFNACGFFTLDYEFVQGVIGSVTTYLVILIQMSNYSESPTTTTANAQHSTEIPANYSSEKET